MKENSFEVNSTDSNPDSKTRYSKNRKDQSVTTSSPRVL